MRAVVLTYEGNDCGRNGAYGGVGKAVQLACRGATCHDNVAEFVDCALDNYVSE